MTAQKDATVNLPLPDSKPHYHLLDGLRGIAALMVLIYHLGEAFATSPADQWCNHGYLSVQFFFVLSGFVISYAYDDRMKRGLSTGQFFLRRIIRLHPMVILGTVLGVIAFLVQGSETWSGQYVGLSYVMLAMLVTLFLIPVSPSSPLDVRGNGEIFPLNGPFWSLLTEYIGNILYAIFLRRLSTKLLTLWCALTAGGIIAYIFANGSGYYQLPSGWTLADGYLWAGVLCMAFCFASGMLVQRTMRTWRIKGAFWICTAAIVVITAMPYVGIGGSAWLNGIYDAVAVILIFPAIVWVAASGNTTDKFSTAMCNFWGRISYPLYALQYPSMYLYYSWVWRNGYTPSQVWPVFIALIAGNILLAYLALVIYDIPVRRWLSSLLLKRPSPK